MRTRLRSCCNSRRTDSVKPWMACFGAAVGGLERDPAVRQRRADLDDCSVLARPHSLEGDVGTVDKPAIGHVSDAMELLRADLGERSERSGECVIHPDVDRPEPLLDAASCFSDGGEVRHVDLDDHCLTVGRRHIGGRCI